MISIPKIQIKASTKTLKLPLLFVASSKKSALNLSQKAGIKLEAWQKKQVSEKNFSSLESKQGPLGFLISPNFEAATAPGEFVENDYSYFRDHILAWLKKVDFQDQQIFLEEGLSAEAARGLGVGLALSSYNYKKQNEFKATLSKKNKDFEKGLREGQAINKARYLVDCPPNILGPTKYKDLILKEFSASKNFKVKVLNRAQLIKQGYSMISAVGAGNDDGPYLVHVEYKNTKAKKSIAAIGKGVTFDSGGLDLKPSQFMRWMKKDMGGSACLFGLASWFKDAQPQINCDFVFCLVENSVDAKSFRPGDIITAKNGLSIEIHNTDAEGRLAMASGFNYISNLKKKFDSCLDVSTLTGAIKVGLDERVAGLFSNDMSLGQSVFEASERSGDPLWLMPLPRWTKKRLDSPFCDHVSCTSGYGGALSAAEFIRLFVPQDTSWFHLDIYAWADSSRDAFATKGATGQGVQVLKEWIESSI